jgi:hypothetical protein
VALRLGDGVILSLASSEGNPMRQIVVLAMAGLCLAACGAGTEDEPAAKAESAAEAVAAETAAAPAAEAAAQPTSTFSHSQTQDLFGYYMPEGEVGEGGFSLIHLHIASAPEFEAWEAGERMATYGPVMMEFLLPGEVSERVLPESYAVTDRTVRMTGTHPDYGRVTLDARFEGPAMTDARSNLGDGEAPTLVGTVTIADRTYPNVRFLYSPGD